MKFLEQGVNATSDQKSISLFLSRGIEKIFPSREAFEKVLLSGKKISIYYGIDPTGPTLHIGHATQLMKLSELQKMGHKVFLLMGDFTAMIGDPSDKLAARKPLTRKEVLDNLKLYKKQASRFLRFTGKNSAKVVFNSKWLSKMDFSDVLDLASKMTVDQMLKRDMFRTRMDQNKPIFIHEFLYPLMQGYDSVALDVDAEMGGNDQTFNMLAGRDLMRSIKDKEKFVIATKLLVDPSGKKMGKTEGNMITLRDTAVDMFGKIMSMPDSLIISGFELCTTVPAEDIEKEKAFLEAGGNPRDSKQKLAFAVASLYHGEAAAKEAKESFTQAFSEGSMPKDVQTVTVSKDALMSDVLVDGKIVSSKGEFKRLVSEKAITDLKTGRTIDAFGQKTEKDMDLKVGKHRFVKIRIG
jgi:tyrosyl-tRNA synthetase